jgi:hypothetical protein
VPIAGEVIDPRHHVNLAWHGGGPQPIFQASLVIPEMPAREWDVPAAPALHPPVPAVIAAWKGKAAGREAGLLDAVEDAVAEAAPRVRDAWMGAAEWQRGSDFLSDLANTLGLLGLNVGQVDQLFRVADAI